MGFLLFINGNRIILNIFRPMFLLLSLEPLLPYNSLAYNSVWFMLYSNIIFLQEETSENSLFLMFFLDRETQYDDLKQVLAVDQKVLRRRFPGGEVDERFLPGRGSLHG